MTRPNTGLDLRRGPATGRTSQVAAKQCAEDRQGTACAAGDGRHAGVVLGAGADAEPGPGVEPGGAPRVLPACVARRLLGTGCPAGAQRRGETGVPARCRRAEGTDGSPQGTTGRPYARAAPGITAGGGRAGDGPDSPAE